MVDLREHAHELANALLTGFAAGGLREVLDALAEADALIAVTPVFQASYSGLFKTFFDVLDDGLLRGLPVLLAATAGTARHSLVLEHAMRPMFAYLKATTVPTAVFAASEDWGGGDLRPVDLCRLWTVSADRRRGGRARRPRDGPSGHPEPRQRAG